MDTLTAWTCYGLAYIFVALYLQFYYETGTYEYVPKRLRLGNRIKAYLTRLASRWRGLINKVQSQRHRWNLKRRTKSAGSNTNRDNNNNNYIHRLYSMNAVLAQQATTRKLPSNFILDSDSKPLGIDNRATAFISGDINDFDGPLHDSDRVVRGFGGIRVKGVKKGTAILRIEDDDGRVHRIKLRDSYYVPDTPDRLFSPQHFAQEMRRQKLGPASETTDDTTCILRWGGYRRTILLDPETNVATIRTAPSNKRFLAYCAEAGFDTGGNPIAFDASLVSDDEGDDDDWWLEADHARHGESSTNATRNSSGENSIPTICKLTGGKQSGVTVTFQIPRLHAISRTSYNKRTSKSSRLTLMKRHYSTITTNSVTLPSRSYKPWLKTAFCRDDWLTAASPCVPHACTARQLSDHGDTRGQQTIRLRNRRHQDKLCPSINLSPPHQDLLLNSLEHLPKTDTTTQRSSWTTIQAKDMFIFNAPRVQPKQSRQSWHSNEYVRKMESKFNTITQTTESSEPRRGQTTANKSSNALPLQELTLTIKTGAPKHESDASKS